MIFFLRQVVSHKFEVMIWCPGVVEVGLSCDIISQISGDVTSSRHARWRLDVTSPQIQDGYQWPLLLRKLTRNLIKRPLVFNGRLANRRLTSLVKEATEVMWPQTQDNGWKLCHRKVALPFFNHTKFLPETTQMVFDKFIFSAYFTNDFFIRNLKKNLMENYFYSHPNVDEVITTIFCTWHHSCAVVAFVECCILKVRNGVMA